MSIFETKIYPSADIESGEIRLYCETLGQKHATEVMYTKDKATRAALIALGWTPPELKKYIFTVFDVEDDEEVDTYELLSESHEFANRIITHIEKFDVDHYYVLFKVKDI